MTNAKGREQVRDRRYINRQYDSPTLVGGRRRNHTKMRIYRAVKRFVFRNKKTKVGTALAICGLMAGSAFAAYIILNNAGSGSGTEQLGTAGQATPMAFHVSWVPGNLTPGDTSVVTVKVDNPNSEAGTLTPANMSGTFTTDKQGCDPTWFTYVPDTSTATGQVAETVPANATGWTLDGSAPNGPGQIKFADKSSTAQDACSGANLTLTLSDNNG